MIDIFKTGVIRISMTLGVSLKNNFLEKWPVVKLPTEKNVPQMLFYMKNLAQFVFMSETQSYCE